MSADSFSTHSVSDCNSTILCATKTIQAMNRLNEKNLGTAPDNPSMSDINDITASTEEKTGNISGNSTERTKKVSQLILYFIQFCQHQKYIYAHTTNCRNTNPTGIRTVH